MNLTLELSNVNLYLNNKCINKYTKNYLIFKKYYEDLKKTKNKIDKYNKCWNFYKKYTNPYELIYSPYDNMNISNYVPISRSFFKLWEILHQFNILKQTDDLLISNLAEGPGGFIECILNYRNLNNDIIISNTLKPSNKSIPSWYKLNQYIKKSNINNNINLDYCNLLNFDEFMNFIKKFKNKKADLVTADGGFDYSNNFNTQEEQSCKIIYSEIIMALNIQNKKGTFILKIFDSFTIYTLKYIYLLCNYYEKVYIYKPLTSRIANSEKYLVCKNFKGIDDNDKDILFCSLNNFKDDYSDMNCIQLSNNFIYKIDLFNKQFVTQQIMNINKTIDLIQNKLNKDINNPINIKTLNNKQIENATEWCKLYNFIINK